MSWLHKLRLIPLPVWGIGVTGPRLGRIFFCAHEELEGEDSEDNIGEIAGIRPQSEALSDGIAVGVWSSGMTMLTC